MIRSTLVVSCVHELGHLLLRDHRHGPGLMTASWSAPEYLRINRRQLHFTREQAGTIRRNLPGQFELARR